MALRNRKLPRRLWHVAALACLCWALACSPRKPEGPNVVLVMADDQGWGDVAYNGHPVLETPHLDAMSRAGLRFDRFYAAAPVCSPTRGSVMTGRHPNRFGCFSWGHPLRPQEVTIAKAFREHGYATGHFGKWHLGSVRRGSPVNPGASGFDEWLSAENFFDNDPILSARGQAVPIKGESSMITVNAAVEFISRCVAQDRPFLAVVWFGSPHSPHRAQASDRALYPDQPEPLQHFYGEITALDRAFGKLRTEIQNLGIRDRTVLWYCSDNGALPEVGSTGGRRGHKGMVYEGGLLVPSILEWPARIPSGRSSEVPAVTSDIFPTLLEFAGIDRFNSLPLDGISLSPLIDGGVESRSKPIGFWHFPEPGIATPSHEWMTELFESQRSGREPEDEWKLRLEAGSISKAYSETELPGHSAWLAGSWKLHRIAEQDGSEVRFELYNLDADPGEEVDLLEDQPARVRDMRSELEEWQRSVIRSLNGQDYKARPEE